MHKNIVVVKLGNDNVVVAEFEDKGPGNPIVAVKSGFCKVAFGDSFKEAIQTAIKEAGIRQRSVIVSVPTPAAFLRFVKLPPVSADKLHQIIAYEAEQNMPYAPEDVTYDYSVIDSEAYDGSGYNTCIVGITNERISQILEQIPDHLKVLGVAVNGLGSANFLHAHIDKSIADGGRGECEMALINDVTTLDVCLIEKDKLFVRNVPKAPQPDDELINDKGEMTPASRNLYTRLYGEITRTMNFYKSQQDGQIPSRAWLFGFSEKADEVNGFFEGKLNMPVNQIFEDASVLQISNGSGTTDMLASLAGVALAEFGRGIVDIKLKPKKNPNAFVRWWKKQGDATVQKALKTLLAFFLVSAGICLIFMHDAKMSNAPVAVAPETNQALSSQSDNQAFLMDLVTPANVPTNIVKVESFSLNAFSAYSDKLSTRKVFIEGRLYEDDKGSIMAGSSWVEVLADRLSHSENYKLGRRVCDIQVDRTIQRNAEGIWTFIVTCQFDLAP